jgi:hypothetical protein
MKSAAVRAALGSAPTLRFVELCTKVEPLALKTNPRRSFAELKGRKAELLS